MLSLKHYIPVEVVDNILSLSSSDTVSSLCLVSTNFNGLATPHLYSSVVLDQTLDLDCRLKHILPFAYRIFTSPSYASLIDSFTIRDLWAEDTPLFNPKDFYEKRPWPRYGQPELESVLKKKCIEYAVDENEADELYEKIKSGENEDAILALLLANLPNLRKLDLNVGFCVVRKELMAMLERVAKRVKPFDKLPSGPIEFPSNDKAKASIPTAFSIPIDVFLTATDYKYPNNPVHLAAFFNLPNLRSIYGWKMGDDDSEPDLENSTFAKLKPRSCPVEYIECRTSKFHQENLKLLMNATVPGRLKTFNYEIGCTWAWCNVDHTEIMKSLEPHHETLECLGLSHEDFYPYEFDNEDEKPDPVSFQQFKALKKLKVAPVYIWGHGGFTMEEDLMNPATRHMLWEALPETLEELWITKAQPQDETEEEPKVSFVPDCLIPALELVVQYKAHRYPKLSHLRIEIPLVDWEDEWLDQLVPFCKDAEEKGIRCTLILAGITNLSIPDQPQRDWGWDEDVVWQECVKNEEYPKKWIDIAEVQDIGKKLREVKALHIQKRMREEKVQKASMTKLENRYEEYLARRGILEDEWSDDSNDEGMDDEEEGEDEEYVE